MRARWAGLAAGMAVVALSIVARAADPDALWKIVHGRCVPDATAGDPAPCAEVAADWAVLKDIVGATQYLLIPTARVTGIESPAVLTDGAPNYFAAAWAARHLVAERAGHELDRDAIALAVNPPGARSQDQLHIHVDCIRPDVRDALARLPIGPAWTALPQPVAGQRYLARTLPGDALEANPFRLLAEGVPGAAAAMGDYTLVVAGRPDGFVLLAGHVGADGRGHGEDVQDHAARCPAPP